MQSREKQKRFCHGPCTQCLGAKKKIVSFRLFFFFFFSLLSATPLCLDQPSKIFSEGQPNFFKTFYQGYLSIMGTGKKEAARKVRQGKVDDGMGNVKTKGENFYRYVLPRDFGQRWKLQWTVN